MKNPDAPAVKREAEEDPPPALARYPLAARATDDSTGRR